jgi:hypothetical protein
LAPSGLTPACNVGLICIIIISIILLYQLKKRLLKLLTEMLFSLSVYESPIAAKTDNSDKVKIYHFFSSGERAKLKIYRHLMYEFGYSSLFDEFV